MFEPHGGRYGFLFVESSIHVISTEEANAYIWVSNVCTASSSEVKGHCILNLYMWCWVRCVHTLIHVDDLHTHTQRTIHACTHAHQCNCKGPALSQIVARCSNKMQCNFEYHHYQFMSMWVYMMSITPKLAISLSSILRQQLHSVCVRVCVCACLSVGVFSSNHQHTSAVWYWFV